MKTNLTVVALAVALSASVSASASSQLTLERVNDEDQRLTDGVFDASNGRLTLYTQDMVPGYNDDIQRRPVVIDGFEAMRGKDGKDGKDGAQGVQGNDGRRGIHGVAGNDGAPGAQGSQGKPGYVDPEVLSSFQNQLDTLDSEQRAGTAAGVAAGTHQYDLGHEGLQGSLSGGYYRGENAVSVGLGIQANGRTFFNGNVTQTSNGHTVFGVGISHKF